MTASASALLRDSVVLCLEAGLNEFVAYGLRGLAWVAATAGQPRRAATLLGAADRLLAETGVDEWPMRRDLAGEARDAARAALGEEAYVAAAGEGRRMSVEAAVQYALTRDEPVSTGAPHVDTGLTRRELEVVRLVAEGHTNREIAAALVLSERTVAKHLDHIFAKLDVSTRTAVATFAVRHGLA